MRLLTLLALLWSFGVVFAQPQMPEQELKILFPDQAAVINGTYINPSQGLMIKTIDGVEQTQTFELGDITGINIPNNVAVTGFTVNNDGGSIASTVGYIFSLSASSGNFVRGDVIECNLDQCDIFDSFGANASISALDYINRVNDLYVSFDTSFDEAGIWIESADVYRASDLFTVFDASANGLSDNNGINAFDTSEFAATFSALKTEEINNEVVKPSEVYSSTLNVGSAVMDELADNITGINAYFSADTGWIEFEQSTINVSEDAGSVIIDAIRVNGQEYDLTVVIRDVDGTAIDGVDYHGVFAQYRFSDDSNQGYELNLGIIDNNIVDGTRSFTVQIIEPNNDYRLSLINPNKNMVTINIIDDDGDLIFADDFE